jgi:cytidylate kinase
MCDHDGERMEDMSLEDHCSLTIAIDGPAGSGKSTVARALADSLGIFYLDTGSLYRTWTWLVLHLGISPTSEDQVLDALQAHSIDLQISRDRELIIGIDGRRMGPELRSPEVTTCVPQLAVHSRVREIITDWQRQLAVGRKMVVDGRDIGTVVFPEADVKIFLTADVHERAERRLQEMNRHGHMSSFSEVKKALVERDLVDSTRSISPLRVADGAIVIDTTNRDVKTVVDTILIEIKMLRKRTARDCLDF